MLKNTATTVNYTVYNTSTGAVVTGDVSNHTAKISKDGGTLTTCANSPTELGNGTYKITLTATECNCSTAQLVVVSSTTDTHIPPVLLAFEAAPSIPTAAQNASAVWGATTRTLTASPTDISGLATSSAVAALQTSVNAVPTAPDNASAVWAAGTRTLTASPTDLTTVIAALTTITALLGRWSIMDDTLTIYADDGITVLGTYTVTRDVTCVVTGIQESA